MNDLITHTNDLIAHSLLSQPAVHAYAIVAAVLVLKMALTGTLTGLSRVVKGVYLTPEDYKFAGKTPAQDDEFIERTRRIHRNDLENILPFLAIGFIFSLTGVSVTAASWLFGIFAVVRVLHTLTYLFSLQPWRTLFYEVGNVVLFIITIWTLVLVA